MAEVNVQPFGDELEEIETNDPLTLPVYKPRVERVALAAEQSGKPVGTIFSLFVFVLFQARVVPPKVPVHAGVVGTVAVILPAEGFP
jgi:hypothetical protein